MSVRGGVLAAGLRGATLLALSAFSLVLCAWQLLSDSGIALAGSNVLPDAERSALLATLIAAFGATFVGSAYYVMLLGELGAHQLGRAARLLAPLVLAAFVPALLTRGIWDPLPTVIAIAGFTLLFEQLLRRALRELPSDGSTTTRDLLPPTRLARRTSFAVVLGCAAFYAAYMSRYTIYMHRRFRTYGYDLGQYDNVFWTTLHGHPMQCVPLGLTHNWQDIGNHADLSVFYFLPFYAIRPNAETLLILQSCMLALGAIPLYLFAARRLSPAYAAAVAVCYLLFPPMHGANFYDFHFQPLASTVVLFTIYFIEARLWIPAAISFVVGLGCREDTSIGLSILGAYYLLSGHRPRAGAVMAAVAAAYFVTMKFYVMPHFWSTWFAEMYKDLFPRPNGTHTFAGVIQTLLTNPVHVLHTFLTSDKLRYFLLIMTPTAFLPLRRSYLVPAIAPGTLFTLLTTGYAPTIDTGFQYSCHFTPYIFAASAVLLGTYRHGDRSRVKLRAGAATLAVATALCVTQWGAFPKPTSIKGGFVDVSFRPPTPADEQKARDLAELFAMIPKDATFSASEEELPHVSGHLHAFSLDSGTNGAEYLLYGTTSRNAPTAAAALQSGEYVELERRPGLGLLKRKH